MKTTIQVETIGYFGDDGNGIDGSSSPLFPPQLNVNQKYLKSQYLRLPFINLNIESPNFEPSKPSFLSYIKKNGWPQNQTPDIVTTGTLISKIASGGETRLKVAKESGVIYISSVDNEKKEDVTNSRYEGILRDFFTGKEDSEDLRIQGIFRARIPTGSRDYTSILYSGDVDAIDESSNQHYAFKVIESAMSTPHFYGNNSSNFYWKAVFENIRTLLVGTRTGEREKDAKTKPPLGYPELSVYKIEQLDRDIIPQKVSQYADKPRSTFVAWGIVDGEIRLQEFVKLVKKTLENENEGFEFTRNVGSEKWAVEKSEDNKIMQF